MKQYFVFVFAKDNKIKCFTLDEAHQKKEILKKNGWVHTHTLDPCQFINYLHNLSTDFEIVNAIKDLSKKNHSILYCKFY
jgi:hypothetical protein